MPLMLCHFADFEVSGQKKNRNRKAEVFSIVSDVLQTLRELWRDFHITGREVVDYPTEIQNI